MVRDDSSQDVLHTSEISCDTWMNLVGQEQFELNASSKAFLFQRVGDEELICEISSILLDLCHRQIVCILVKKDAERCYSVEVDISALAEKNQWLTNLTTAQPEIYLPLYNVALAKAQVDLIKSNIEVGQKFVYKSNCFVRFYLEEGLLAADESQIKRTPRSDEVGSWRVLRSTVVRTSTVKLAEFLRIFECKKCNSRWIVEASREHYNSIVTPSICRIGGLQCGGSSISPVNSTNTAAIEFCRDYQEIRVQEPINKLTTGIIPRCVTIIIENDLTDKCQPGDEVLISGIVIRRFKFPKSSDRCEVEIAIVANHIRVISDYMNAYIQPTDSLVKRFESYWSYWRAKNKVLEARDKMVRSFSNGLYGMYLVKLSVLLILVGGVENTNHEIKLRGDAHLLLVGDPGTGKSQILRYAARLGTRSVLTNSVGTTSAGLTCSAVKDGGEWQLEAGALVLADRGVCFIDEFGSLKSHDRIAIHEAMEQQTISVAKAGLVCKLNARCAVIAATNPKGKYDPSQPMAINVALASPLLSRFDLIFVLLDKNDTKRDSWLSSFVLDCHSNDKLESFEETSPNRSSPVAHTQSSIGYERHPSKIEWTPEILQAYIAHVKTLKPNLGKDAKDILTAYYQIQRSATYRDNSRTTIRMLESLIRLSQAHAKFTMSNKVTILDAIFAVILVENSLQSSTLVEKNLNLDGISLYSDFPENPDEQIYNMSLKILDRLNLSHLKEVLPNPEHNQYNDLDKYAHSRDTSPLND